MLTKPLAVMVNRGGQNLDSGRLVAKTMELPLVGEDPEDLVLTDGGNAMVGFGFRQANANLLAQQCCSKEFLRDVTIAVNPATQLEFVPGNFTNALKSVSVFNLSGTDLDRFVAKGKSGQQVSFFDVNGNLSTFSQPVVSAQAGPVATKLRTLLPGRGAKSAATAKPKKGATLIGVNFLVADLQASLKFYRNTLGIKVLKSAKKEVKLDAGPIILTLQEEPHIGMVKSLKEQDLLRDQVIFHVPDITAETRNLGNRGVRFPRGIEGSLSTGKVAFFTDPSGHNLWLWEPPPRFDSKMRINFFPVLKRILRAHG